LNLVDILRARGKFGVSMQSVILTRAVCLRAVYLMLVLIYSFVNVIVRLQPMPGPKSANITGISSVM
jgi:hypothetical protein